MRVTGNDSIRALQSQLLAQFGTDTINFGNEIRDDQDAFGWRCLSAPQIDFSISTHAGQMPYGQYDLQISIRDNSSRNGDVLFNDDVDTAGVIEQIERFAPMPPVA